MEELFTKGELSDVQARFFCNYRPAEELYNLKDDPYEINNLTLYAQQIREAVAKV